MAETAKVTLGGETYELPIIEGSEGEKAIDITSLRATTKHITRQMVPKKNALKNVSGCVLKIMKQPYFYFKNSRTTDLKNTANKLSNNMIRPQMHLRPIFLALYINVFNG